MDKFIIDPQSIDVEAIKADLTAYLDSTPDAAKWKDFFESGAGQTVKELIAGLATFYAYQNIVARRETFLRHIENRSSAIGIAENNGYSVFRGKNAHVTLTVVPDVTQTIPKYSIVGTVKDQFLITTEEYFFNEGTALEIKCVVGSLKEETMIVDTIGPKLFRYEKKTVSDDFRLLLNGTEVVTSDRIIEAGAQKFIVNANPFDSIDVLYLNDETFDIKLKIGDELKVEFIDLLDLEFNLTDVVFDYGLITGSEITSLYQEPESIEDIKINAPLFNDTQYVVRARADYAKLIRLLNSSVIDASFKNISPSVVELFYIRDNLTFFSPEEEAELLTQLNANRAMGLQPPTFGRSIRNKIALSIEVKLFKSVPNIVDQIKKIVAFYEKKLSGAINFELIENAIEDIENVKVARVKIKPTVWTAGKKFEIGQYCRAPIDNGRVYRATRIKYFSGSTEPVWPTTVGAQITDGSVIWECKYLERQCDPEHPLLPLIPPRAAWLPNTDYKMSQVIIPNTLDIYEYKVIGFINKSGTTAPAWPTTVGETVIDGDLVWMAREIEGETPAAWVAETNYKKGDVIKAGDKMYQVIAFLGTTDSAEPTFSTSLDFEFSDGNIEWICKDASTTPFPLPADQFYLVDTTVTLS